MKITEAWPSLNSHILFYSNGLSISNSNGLAVWHGLSDIRNIKLIMADGRPFKIWSSCNFSGHIPTWNRAFCFYANGLTNYGRWSAI